MRKILISTVLVALAMVVKGDNLICYECCDGDCTTFTGDENYNFGMPTNCTESQNRCVKKVNSGMCTTCSFILM